MKKIFTLLVALVATTALWAEDFEVGGIYYNILADKTNEVEVTFRGSDYDSYSNEYSGSVTIPSTVTYNGITYSVTSIGEDAFYKCSGLTSVTIGNSVTSIGDDAFWNCYRLRSITIPNSVTSIGNYAFYACTDLRSITIPNSVKSIGDYAFYHCSGLKSITIPNSVTSIGESAFESCTGLTSVTIPNSVTSIGYCAFSWCSGLTSITIPNSVTSIGYCAFSCCSGLTSITIPNSVTSIGDIAFNGCSGLTSVTIPNSVTSIGESAFENCSGLTSIVVEDGNTVYDSRENCNAIIETNSNTLVAGCKNTTIPNSVTSIGNFAFYGCSGLTSVSIPNSVTSIGDWAFRGCYGLTSINVWAEVPPTLDSSVFTNVSKSIPVYVPCGSVSAYQSAEGWKAFTNIQGPLAEYSIAVGVNDNKMGTAKVDENTICGAQISATANYGYYFTQWSDGETDNPRILVLTQDTILTAEFAQTYSGQCGDNLYWSFNDKTLTITGFGAMWNERPWGLFVDEIQNVVLPSGLTHIGDDTFTDCVGLSRIDIPYSVISIGDNSFAGCRKLFDVYCYALTPPEAETTSFANYNVYLHVPCDNLIDYQMDMVFGSFKYIQCVGSEQVEIEPDSVIIQPSTNDVTITWPTDPNAETYVIVIKQGDKVFCSLTFNADGMLLNIAFAPSRSGSHPVTYAASTGNGLRFTVTSLDAATTYGYDITTKDEEEKILSTYTGEFTTKSNVSTSVSDIQSPMTDCQKLIRDGQLFILRDGKTYNAMGVEM